MPKLSCNHCGAAAYYDEKIRGNKNLIEEQTGMVLIRKKSFLAFGEKAYCMSCMTLIRDRALLISKQAILSNL